MTLKAVPTSKVDLAALRESIWTAMQGQPPLSFDNDPQRAYLDSERVEALIAWALIDNGWEHLIEPSPWLEGVKDWFRVERYQ